MSQHDFTDAIKAADAELLPVTLDRRYYKSKPDRHEMARMTKRMKTAEHVYVSKLDFCRHIQRGGSWIGGHFDNGLKELKRLRLIALDFDRPENLPPLAALDRCIQRDCLPMALYFTLSASHEKPKYRLVFDVGEDVTDAKEAADLIAYLLAVFPEADIQCKDPSRRWLGSCGEFWQLWRYLHE